MAFLIIQNAQIKGFDDSITEIENTSIINILMRHFSDGIDPENTTIMLNDRKLSFESDDLLIELNHNDRLTVINEVKGVELAYAVVIAIVAAAVAIALVPDPQIPNEQGQTKSSANNQFSGQSNLARAYQSWPVILGSIVSYPDLIGEPVYEYKDNSQFIQQHFAVGFGTVAVDNIRVGDSKIGNFVGSSAIVRTPISNNTVINDYRVGFSSPEIEGQILKGLNSGDAAYIYNLSFFSSSTSNFGSNSATIYLAKNTGSDELFTDYNASPSNFILKISFLYDEERIPGEPDVYDGEGNGVISSMTDNTTYYTVYLSDYVGDQTDDPFAITSASRQAGNQVGPISVSKEVEQLWFSLTFPRGLKANIDIEILVEKLNSKGGEPSGFTYTYSNTFNDNTLDPRYKTVKLNTQLDGLGWYRYTISRTNNEADDATTPDEVRVERVQGIREYASNSFGDVTLLEVNLTASGGVSTSNNTKINCDATALMPTKNDLTLRKSRKFADGVLHTYINYYGLDISQVNIDALYDIQYALDATTKELGYFDFSFDDGDINLQQRLETICNAARVSTFLTNGQWQFVRDELRDYPSGLISGRDIAKNDRDYSITGGGSNPSDYDGLRLEYVDPDTNKKAYIRKKISGGAFVDGESANPKIIELAGCRNETQARNRAELEIRKLAYQVETLTETVLPSGSIFDKGNVVLYAEQYESIAMDGEILKVSGNNIVTSELLTFGTGTYKLYHTLIDGSLSTAKAITPISTAGSFRAFLDDTSGIFTRDGSLGYNVQTGSRYIVVKDDEFEQTKWVLTEKTARGRNTQLTFVNYDERVYDYD